MREILDELAALLPGLRKPRPAEGDGLKTFLVQGSVGTFSLRIVSTGLAFATSIMLARMLGATGYGTYTYALSWSLLLVVLAVMGFDKLLVRYVAVYQAEQRWGKLNGLLRRTGQAVFAVSLVVALTAAAATLMLTAPGDRAMRYSLLFAFALLPVYARIRLKQAALQGLRQVVSGQVPEIIVQAILFIMLLSGAYFVLDRIVYPQEAVFLFTVAAATTLVMLTQMLRRARPAGLQGAVPAYETKLWIKTALPLLFVDSMYLINSRTDIIMLGAMRGTAEAGIYNVANRGAEFVTFVLLSVDAVLAPAIAALHEEGDKERLQNIITLAAQAVLLFSLPVASIFIFFGRYFLMIFGNEFVAGSSALAILSIAQLFNCAAGSVGLVLIMTGHQKEAAIGIAVSAALNVALNALLIPMWGITGAAVATGFSIVAWNLIYVVWVYKKLGYHTTALGRIRL